jgi:serine/threonine-protein kinase
LLICPTCQTHFEGEAQFCPQDGSPLAASPPAGADDPLVGRVLGGRYRLVQRLGQGGMGTVYRAVHTLMDKPVAVKILRHEMSSDAEAVARFHREARSASRLDHDHCIRVTDFGQSDDGLLFLVMELLDGVSLGHIARRGPLPPARVAAIGLAIAEALAHAHEQGIVHRDLKPDNVFLARRAKGRELVKVLDFGLAKLASDSVLGPSITRDGTVFGTPEYMAPEQAEGEKLDGRTDIYALGAILYELLSGEVPFKAGSFVAMLNKQVSEKPVSTRARRPDLDIPVGLDEVVMRCLAKKPGDRYETAQALADAIAPFTVGDPSGMVLLPRAEGPGAPLSPSPQPATRNTKLPTPPPSIEVPRVRRGLLVIAGAAAVGVTFAIAWTKTRKPTTTAPPPLAAVATPPEAPLTTVTRLLATGDLDGADRLLAQLRAKGDSVELQESLSAAAERRGNRLGALAHLHRATRIAPKDAVARARLAALLVRLGQPAEACRQAQKALALDPKVDARAVLAQARCKENP